MKPRSSNGAGAKGTVEANRQNFTGKLGRRRIQRRFGFSMKIQASARLHRRFEFLLTKAGGAFSNGAQRQRASATKQSAHAFTEQKKVAAFFSI
jgi:hypothetical protein